LLLNEQIKVKSGLTRAAGVKMFRWRQSSLEAADSTSPGWMQPGLKHGQIHYSEEVPFKERICSQNIQNNNPVFNDLNKLLTVNTPDLKRIRCLRSDFVFDNRSFLI